MEGGGFGVDGSGWRVWGGGFGVRVQRLDLGIGSGSGFRDDGVGCRGESVGVFCIRVSGVEVWVSGSGFWS